MKAFSILGLKIVKAENYWYLRSFRKLKKHFVAEFLADFDTNNSFLKLWNCEIVNKESHKII